MSISCLNRQPMVITSDSTIARMKAYWKFTISNKTTPEQIMGLSKQIDTVVLSEESPSISIRALIFASHVREIQIIHVLSRQQLEAIDFVNLYFENFGRSCEDSDLIKNFHKPSLPANTTKTSSILDDLIEEQRQQAKFKLLIGDLIKNAMRY